MSEASSLLKQEMFAGQNVLLVGPPGTGKTSIILKTAKECGFEMEVETEEGIQSTLLRASLMERVDWTGCMVPDHQMGVTRQLPFSLVNGLRKTKKKTVLFLDDMGQAPMDTQASFMRSFDNEFLGKNVVVWAATNRPGDKAGVNALCEPLRSRFHAKYIIPTPETTNKADGGTLLCDWNEWVDNWINWALSNDAPPEVVGWHKSTNGKSLYNWKPHADPSICMPDFRSWGAIIDRWNKGLRSLDQLSAVIGKGCAAEFLSYASLTNKLPSSDQVWADPLGSMMPDDPSAQWLICFILTQQVKSTCVNEFLKYITRMPRIMTAFAARSCFLRIGKSLSANRIWTKWVDENEGLFGIE